MIDLDKEREAFEDAFATETSCEYVYERGEKMDSFGDYFSKPHNSYAWVGWELWKACAESKQVEIDALKNENTELLRQNRKLKHDVKVGDECIKRREQLINIRETEIADLKAKLAKYESQDFVLVPKEPELACLNSMALRYRHDFGLLGAPIQGVIIQDMRKMYEEATGQGFYTPEAAQGDGCE